MSIRYKYEMYKKHCYGKPIGYRWFCKNIDKYGLEGMLIRSIKRHEKSYSYYLERCEYREVTPLSQASFSRGSSNKNFWAIHKSIHEKELTLLDKLYIEKRPDITVNRKSFINQNMCLFYKMYFKRKQRKLKNNLQCN